MSLFVVVSPIARRHVLCAASTYSQRDYCSNVKVVENPTTASLRRGTGGRSSFNGYVATVFGATGFVGRYLVNELGKTGTQVIIPYRSDPDDNSVKKLKVAGDLGQILFQPFDLRDGMSIRKAMKYSNVVFNLIGSHFETKNFKFDDVHVKGARDIAAACRDMKVNRLIHMSSLNVTENPKAHFLPKPLNFLKSKLQGEQAVLEEFPDATIFRPAVIFGKYDRFLTSLQARHRRILRSIPLWAGGQKTVKQPVYIYDVIQGLVTAMKDDDTKGKIYQAVGPERYLLSEIADYSGRIIFGEIEKSYCHNILFDPFSIFKIILARYIFGAFFFQPRWDLCFEQIEMEATSDEMVDTLPTLEDLGVKLTRLEAKAEHIVKMKNLVRGFHHKDHVAYETTRPPLPYGSFL
ncbi:UNVERIFIED_CONTAM: hypothetical protein PYX00_005631 [Menopon gallinae]|uniref:NADH dehydrogenase [ubiquinone] 1 alpha subcomplex subunit 9, mitochondrial n=1 Tax=Menopon gallinae TaxID=328185 RepID=A0AAW2HT70_9NEOP